jgi:hypothetical protein
MLRNRYSCAGAWGDELLLKLPATATPASRDPSHLGLNLGTYSSQKLAGFFLILRTTIYIPEVYSNPSPKLCKMYYHHLFVYSLTRLGIP